MLKNTLQIYLAVLTCIVLLLTPHGSDAGAFNGQDFYSGYAKLLINYVDGDGMVDYQGMKNDRAGLDRFTIALGNFDSDVFSSMSTEYKVAFLVNAYNAFTLTLIIDNYPIQSKKLAGLRYPANSIRQISGAWDSISFKLLGKGTTLDHIEHEMLRKQFNTAGIHMALVCAAMSCPPLRNEPYYGASLDLQLKDQTRNFIANPDKFRIDRAKKRVYLSSIFKWFGDDFIPRYGTDKYPHLKNGQRAVINYLYPFLSAKDQQFLQHTKYKISFTKYDWSLNEK